MAFCLVVNLTTRNKLQWNINRNSYIFIHENAFECVVCEMAAICLGINVLTYINSSTEGSLHTRQWCSSMNGKTHLRTWWESKIGHLKPLLLLREEYSRINISLPWVLMPWLMWFLWQQYPWWWLCRINVPFDEDNYYYANISCCLIYASAACLVTAIHDIDIRQHRKFSLNMVLTEWRHQMETFSAQLAICAGIHRSPVNSPHTKASDAELWCFLWSAPE